MTRSVGCVRTPLDHHCVRHPCAQFVGWNVGLDMFVIHDFLARMRFTVNCVFCSRIYTACDIGSDVKHLVRPVMLRACGSCLRRFVLIIWLISCLFYPFPSKHCTKHEHSREPYTTR